MSRAFRLRRSSLSRFLLPFALSLSACALEAPPAERLLLDSPASPATTAEIDRQAREALERSKAKPDDVELALRASALLFAAADARMQRASLALLAGDEKDPETLIRVDDRVGDPARTEILSLCQSGLDAAERAIAQAPDSVGAHLHKGLHLSLVAWANGPARSAFAGYGSRLVDAIARAVALDPTFDHASPLRLQGRFRSQAPWPYKDREVARAALERAVELSPVVVNHLFLGDACWLDNDQGGARLHWLAATRAAGTEATKASDDQLRELARRRIEAAAR